MSKSQPELQAKVVTVVVGVPVGEEGFDVGWKGGICYELMSLGSDNRTTLVLSNTRELDRVPSTK